MRRDLPVFALTQGDPAGIGPEVLLRSLEEAPEGFVPLLILEQAALEAIEEHFSPSLRDRLRPVGQSDLETLELTAGEIAWVDPVATRRRVTPGRPTAADAGGAVAALDLGLALCRRGRADALVTAPVSKATIARHHLPAFRGHTDYLARACGLERYGRDYLMAFLAPELQVALLSVHQPLRQAIGELSEVAVADALACLDRHAGGRIAVAGLNPHAGEGGLLGREDLEVVAPAVVRMREAGLAVRGPESADSLFARARGGEFDWVLALYHDQGLIAVKTLGFGLATNWTLGLPVLRTSVDHGTAFDLAGRGVADVRPMRQVLRTTLSILEGDLPRGLRPAASD